MAEKKRHPNHVRPQFYADGFVVPYRHVGVADYHREIGHFVMSGIVNERMESPALAMGVMHHWQRMVDRITGLKVARDGKHLASIAKKAVVFAFIDAETNRRVEREELEAKSPTIGWDELSDDLSAKLISLHEEIDSAWRDGDFPDYDVWRRTAIQAGDIPAMLSTVREHVEELGATYFPGMGLWNGPEVDAEDPIFLGEEFRPVGRMLHDMVEIEVRDRGDGMEVWIGEPERLSHWAGESPEGEENPELTEIALLDDLGADSSTLISLRMACGALTARIKAGFQADGFEVDHRKKPWNENSTSLNVVMHHTIYAVPDWPRGTLAENQVPIEDFLNLMDDVLANVWQETHLALDSDRVNELKMENLQEAALYPLYAHGGDQVIDMATGKTVATLTEAEASEDLDVIARRLKADRLLPTNAMFDEKDDLEEFIASSARYYCGESSLQDVMRSVAHWESRRVAPAHQIDEFYREEDDDALMTQVEYAGIPAPPGFSP